MCDDPQEVDLIPIEYAETDEDRLDREKAFTYHPPKATQPDRYQDIRALASGLAKAFNAYCPPSRERSLAHSKLEEAVMWANAAIARNE